MILSHLVCAALQCCSAIMWPALNTTSIAPALTPLSALACDATERCETRAAISSRCHIAAARRAAKFEALTAARDWIPPPSARNWRPRSRRTHGHGDRCIPGRRTSRQDPQAVLPNGPARVQSLSAAARDGYSAAPHRAGRGVAQEDSRSVTSRRRSRHRRYIRGGDNIGRAAPPHARQLLGGAQTDGHARRAARAAERRVALLATARVRRRADLAPHQIITEELERNEDCHCSYSWRRLLPPGVALHGRVCGERQLQRVAMVPAAAGHGRRDGR